jgi:hypothetical protein
MITKDHHKFEYVDPTNKPGACSRSRDAAGSGFRWIVDRPPTREDADVFGDVACTKRGSEFIRVSWQECANGFIRPWARIEDVIKSSVDERLKFPISFCWPNNEISGCEPTDSGKH